MVAGDDGRGGRGRVDLSQFLDIVEHDAKVAKARAKRLEEVADDPEAAAALAHAPSAAPLVPGHHLGVAAQPKRRRKKS